MLKESKAPLNNLFYFGIKIFQSRLQRLNMSGATEDVGVL